MIRRRLRAAASAALLMTVAACGGGSNAATRLEGAVAEPPLFVGDQQLPEGENGEPFTFRAPEGELLAVYFGYTQCPDLCPTTMADIKAALALLPDGADRVSVAMVTVDPERDNAKILTAYLGHFFGEASHPLRTTDSEQLKSVEKAFLATSNVQKTRDEVIVEHTATTSIVDDSGTVVVQWPFGTTAESMAHDFEILLDREPASAKT
ncbi:MAG: SCO family protein [Acidimicrobiia bacterium]